MVDINVNGNSVTLTLSWGEPFINNLYPMVNYTLCHVQVMLHVLRISLQLITLQEVILSLT